MMIIAGAVLLCCIAYILACCGRGGYPPVEELKKWRYAHRGLHNSELPENSMAAFQSALEHGYGVELDIHLLSDGSLAVVHDSNLSRVTGQNQIVEELKAGDLAQFKLMGTQETIPLFSQVLELFGGKAPIIVELKVYNNNVEALCEAAAEMLDNYKGLFCIESFDPRCILWFRKNRPQWIRGQLSHNYLRYKTQKSRIIDFLFKNYLLNFLTQPDFIAHRFEDRNSISITICRKLWKIAGVSWTIHSMDELKTAEEEGWIPIFENFVP